MNKKLLPLLVLAALSSAAHAATPPNTLVVAQGLDDIVSLDPAEANELSSIQTVPSLYQRLVQPDRDNPEKNHPGSGRKLGSGRGSKNPDHQT